MCVCVCVCVCVREREREGEGRKEEIDRKHKHTEAVVCCTAAYTSDTAALHTEMLFLNKSELSYLHGMNSYPPVRLHPPTLPNIPPGVIPPHSVGGNM